eukprot:jgi/Tetstr1/423244/TSEL_001361.t1
MGLSGKAGAQAALNAELKPAQGVGWKSWKFWGPTQEDLGAASRRPPGYGRNYECGCCRDIEEFIPKDDYPGEAGMSWTVQNFGKPAYNVYETAPYTQPNVTVPYC